MYEYACIELMQLMVVVGPIGLCTHACSSAVSRVSRMLHLVIKIIIGNTITVDKSGRALLTKVVTSFVAT